MRLTLFIALRYLFARKSHNVINVISAISGVGMAVGTAALIIILSVFNGFNSIIKSNLSPLEADLRIVPAEGKVFIPEGPAFDALYDSPEAGSISSVISDKVFISYEGKQGVVDAKGVDRVYEEETGISLRREDTPLAVVGSDIAWKLGINPKFLAPLSVWYPDRSGTISPSNPAASLRSEDVYPSEVKDIPSTIIIPIEVMSRLTAYASEVTSVEVRFSDGLGTRQARRFTKRLRSLLGSAYIVQDRFMQNEALYKMMRSEKAAIFMILVFIVIIIALNIFGSLSMLVIEKKEDIATLKALGGSDSLVNRIFILEGWLITLFGMAAGVTIGIAAVLLQQRFGIIKMPGNFLVEAYPVVLQASDVLLSAAGVALTGLLVALAPVFSRSR